MADPETIERLDLMLAVLQLAHHDAIQQAGAVLRQDPVNVAVLEACADDWISPKDLVAKVLAETDVKERTIRQRIADLLTRRAITKRGSGSNTVYRSLGLV